MIGLDTNVLARYYIEDATDVEAEPQREAARRLIESGQPLMVSKTVLLELEWLMRGYYRFAVEDIRAVFGHLLELPQADIEDRAAVTQAVANLDAGLEFADALHHASYRTCSAIASFDDRKFARLARRMGLTPSVIVPV
ncbi:MAG: type II toxin-antitoxin system VapC family toxin [bacterium]|jgi:predicted nucleic-acid-binding protein|nr:type II toxin-antitoxin system VapC family toxin [Betaproteobacteria bacterium]